MSSRNGQLGQVQPGGDDGDMVCRTIVAAIAAMLALRACQLFRRLVKGQ